MAVQPQGYGADDSVAQAIYESVDSDAKVIVARSVAYNDDITMSSPFFVAGVAVVYRLDGGSNDIVLSRRTLAAIWSGSISTWDDEEIAAGNPEIGLPSLPIKVASRSDESQTTWADTSALVKTMASRPPFRGSRTFGL